MMYWCNECKQSFDEPRTHTEWVGDRIRGGYVDYDECPNCGSGAIALALMCPNCGEYCGELFGFGKNQLCAECVEKAATLENVIDWCDDDKQSVEINCALIELLPVSEIEAILTEYLLTAPKTPLMEKRIRHLKLDFVEDNKDDFAEYVSKEIYK